MITKETRKQVWEREAGRCENPECLKFHPFESSQYEIHHRYFRSQYKMDDRDDPWNLSLLCGEECHKNGSGAVHGGNSVLDKYLKAKADKAKPEAERSFQKMPKDMRAKKIRKDQYRSKVESFKKKHGGLSPWQVRYRQQKKFLSDNMNDHE